MLQAFEKHIAVTRRFIYRCLKSACNLFHNVYKKQYTKNVVCHDKSLRYRTENTIRPYNCSQIAKILHNFATSFRGGNPTNVIFSQMFYPARTILRGDSVFSSISQTLIMAYPIFCILLLIDVRK